MQETLHTRVLNRINHEPAQIHPGTAIVSRVLLCPDTFPQAVTDRADSRSRVQAEKEAVQLLASLILATAAQIPGLSVSTRMPLTRVEQRIRGSRYKESGRPVLPAGELDLWKLKEAGYHMQIPEQLIIYSVPRELFFTFENGKLLLKNDQMKAAFKLLQAVGEPSNDYTYATIVRQLQAFALKYRQASDGYTWQVIFGKHQTNPNLEVAGLAFGEVVPNTSKQKQRIQEWRTSQLAVYQEAMLIEGEQHGVAKPSDMLLGILREILFSSDRKSVLECTHEIAEMLAFQGFSIGSDSLVNAVAMAYHAVWNSAYSTEQSIKGRF